MGKRKVDVPDGDYDVLRSVEASIKEHRGLNQREWKARRRDRRENRWRTDETLAALCVAGILTTAFMAPLEPHAQTAVCSFAIALPVLVLKRVFYWYTPYMGRRESTFAFDLIVTLAAGGLAGYGFYALLQQIYPLAARYFIWTSLVATLVITFRLWYIHLYIYLANRAEYKAAHEPPTANELPPDDQPS